MPATYRLTVCVGAAVALLVLPGTASAAACSWTGLGATISWSDAANWNNCGGAHATPQNGDDLVFPAGASRPSSVNDLAGLSLASVRITGIPAAGTKYIIWGQSIVLGAGGLQFQTPADGAGNGPIFNVPIVLGSPLVIGNLGTGAGSVETIDVNGSALTFTPAAGDVIVTGIISGAGAITKNGGAALDLRVSGTFTGLMQIDVGTVRVRQAGSLGSAAAGTTVGAGARLAVDTATGGFHEPITLDGGVLAIERSLSDPFSPFASLGRLTLTADSTIDTTAFSDVFVNDEISGQYALTKSGQGALEIVVGSPSFTGATIVQAGALFIDGQNGFNGGLPNSAIMLSGGTLTGIGAVGTVSSTSGILTPGTGSLFGRDLRTRDVLLNAGTTYRTQDFGPGRLIVNGRVDLGNAKLEFADFAEGMTLIDNDGTDPIVGTFAGMPDGALLQTFARTYVLSYRGGTGNDVTVEVAPPARYLLSEGATGPFFDEDISIANFAPGPVAIGIDFLTPSGPRTLPFFTMSSMERRTIRVDEIPGLEHAEVATSVTSVTGAPVVVERSMFWDARYYAGHTSSWGQPPSGPSSNWYFAEGSQGYFHTYVQLANGNQTTVDVNVTFLREVGAPVIRTLALAAMSRSTIDCSAIPELADQSFAITVQGSAPISAERAMYFGISPTYLFAGGHATAGAIEPERSWLFAEGATGTFFDTFILISNPQNTPAHVSLGYLLESGETVTTSKTIPPNARLTVNVEAEGDPRLANAAVSTIVTADLPIVAERSMYWVGSPGPWMEGHNSLGVAEAGVHWGLAEGRVGGPRNFHTYLQLANPTPVAADVTVTFVPDTGTRLTRTYSVRPASRYTIDVNAVSPTLQNQSVAADIRVTNGVPIVAERSMYWDAEGVFFKGGTNATAVRLP